MLNPANTLLLLSVPVLWMGVVQLCFGLLSRWVFDDGVALFFMESAIPMIMLPLLLVVLAWKYRLNTVSYRDALLFATLTVSFALHFGFLSTGRFKVYWRNEEARVFVLMVVFLSLGLAIWLFAQGNYGIGESLSFAFFHVVSFITSTGYGAADLSSWPPGTDLFLVTVAYLGGCAGSTAGGNKVIRDILAFKIVYRQFKLLIHSRAKSPIHYTTAQWLITQYSMQ